jgi:chromosome segregation ATPase
MPPIDPDAPWWANVLLVLVVLAAVPAATTWLTNRPTRRTLHQVAADAKEARDQVANTHDTNMRDDLDGVGVGLAEIRHAVGRLADAQQAVREDIGGLHSEVRDQRLDIAGIRTDARRDRRALAAVRTDLASAVTERDQAIAQLREQMPGLIASHVTACPLRHDDTTT